MAIVAAGKNEWAVRQALHELGIEVVERGAGEGALVIGTLSPGPLLDAIESTRGEAIPVVAPWSWTPSLVPEARRAG